MSLFAALIALAESGMRHSLEEEGVILIFGLGGLDEEPADEGVEPLLSSSLTARDFDYLGCLSWMSGAERYRWFHLRLNDVSFRPPRKRYLNGHRRLGRSPRRAPIRVMEGYNFR